MENTHPTGRRGSRERLVISGIVFGLIAGLAKAVIFPAPTWNPPFIFPMLTAFFAAVFFWWALVERSGKTTSGRGLVAGGLVGLATPPLMWLPYGLFLTATLGRGIEPLLWAPVYALLTLRAVSPFAMVLGAVVGAVLASVQR